MTKSFLAEVVEIVGKGMPAVFNEETESKGLTRDLFHLGSTVLVAVRRKAPGAIPNSAAAYTHFTGTALMAS